MKNQALFSSTDKSKKFKCRLLQFLFGALRVKEEVKTGKDRDFLWTYTRLLKVPR